MHVSLGPTLTSLTCCAACIGWFASIEMAIRMQPKEGWRRRVWLAASAGPIGVVLWWLHLLVLTEIAPVGASQWIVWPTALSLLIAVVSSVLCLSCTRRTKPRRRLLVASIAAVGLASIRPVDLVGIGGLLRTGFDPALVGSIAAALAAAWLSLLAPGLGRRVSARLALVLLLAIATTIMVVLPFDPTTLARPHAAGSLAIASAWLIPGAGFCAFVAVVFGLVVSVFDRRVERLTERSVRLVRRNEERLQRLLQQLPFGIVVADVTTDAVVFSNREADRILHGAERGRGPRTFFPANDSMGDPLGRALRDEETVGRELQTFGRADGQTVTLEISAAPIYDERDRLILAIAAFQDVSVRVSAEADLRQAQKMDAIGQLTGGIAHDTNNLLTAILGNLDLLEPRLTDENQRVLLRNALSATERGAKLTSQLLGFSRRQSLAPSPVDVNRAVADMHPLLVSTLGGTIRIDCTLGTDLWPAYADPTQLELVLLNLAINARDAMPAGGTITIGTTNVVLTQPLGPTDPRPGQYVSLSVRDNGTGIAPATLSRVFEPFFTTKGPGRGSGLGLSQVLGIAQQLGGGVRISSELGQGTVVQLFMPRSLAAVEPRPVSSRLGRDGTNALDGKTVLLVDDDDDVRTAARALLAGFGCIVIEEPDGRAAVARVAGAERIDLVLIDFAMPGMTGADAGERIRAIRPNLPILVITGYAEADHLPGVEGRFPTLQKPFRGTQLAELLPTLLPSVPTAMSAEAASVLSFPRARRTGREAPVEPFSRRDLG